MSNFRPTLNSAVFLLKQIQSKAIEPRKLSEHQRRICVGYLLRSNNYDQIEIANIMNVTASAITQMKHTIERDMSYLIDHLEEKSEAAKIVDRADMLSRRAAKKGNEKVAWEITKEAIEVLQSMGYLKKQPLEIEGNITLMEILKRGTQKDSEPIGHTGNGVIPLNGR